MNLRFMKWLLLPAAGFYDLITKSRNFLYDRGIFKTVKMPVPVIAVGNITAGGTGKTPFVIALAEFLSQSGYRVAVVTRGYRRQSKGQVIISNGKQILATPSQAGDEPYLIAEKLPGTVVIADTDRTAAARTAIDNFRCDVIVADDAFQHRRLGRKLNIVLWDSRTPPEHEHLLPFGRLRESWRGLQRADLLVFAKSDNVIADQKTFLLKYNSRMQFCAAPLTISGLGDLSGKMVSATDVAGKIVLAFCGLGNHAQFEATVQKLHPAQIIFRRFPDHHKYSATDLRQLLALAEHYRCDFLLTTEKDAVNLPEPEAVSSKILIVKIELKLDEIIKAAVLKNLPPSQISINN